MIVAIVALSSAGLTALGLTVGTFMESPEGFQLLSSIIASAVGAKHLRI